MPRWGSVTGTVIAKPDRLMMTVPQPLWFFLPMLILLIEQPFLPISVLPTFVAIIFAVGAQHRLARSRRRSVAQLFGRLSPLDHRWGMLLRLVDDEGRKWETRFLPVRGMELLANDPVFADGWITRRGELFVWGLTNIRTGVHRKSRRLAVWPVVTASVAITALVVIAAFPA